MKSFLKSCAFATLLGLALATTVQAAESSKNILNTHQVESQSTQMGEYTESVEQPIIDKVPDRGFSTLSGESLHGIENRNLMKDSSSVFSKTSSLSGTQPIFLRENSSGPVIQVPTAIEELRKKIEFDAGESSVDSNQILKLQYRLSPAN